MPQTLLVIVAAARPGRSGRALARWFVEFARAHSTFAIEFADLAELDLPFFDEPQPPRLGQYVRDHTRRWSQQVAAADAFVVITPEYNHSYTAVLKNALDYLAAEWASKPIGFLSYGGVSGGVRAVEALLPVVVSLGMVPTPTGIVLPFVQNYVGPDGSVTIPDVVSAPGITMLADLERLAEALRPGRPQPEMTPDEGSA